MSSTYKLMRGTDGNRENNMHPPEGGGEHTKTTSKSDVHI